MRYIHFFPDDKFAKFVFKQFEQKGIYNEYCVFTKSDKLKFVDFEATKIFNSDIGTSLIKHANSFDALFVHYLGPEARRLLSLNGLNTKVFWIGWGGDYYWLINDLKDFELYRPLTFRERYLIPYNYLFNQIFTSVRKIYHRSNRKILSRIDYFSPVLKIEFDIIKNNYPVRFQYFGWNYGSLDGELVPYDCKIEDDSNGVLVGNSATYSNNFFDLFQDLRSIDVRCDVYCPLTYGNKKLNRDIIQKGSKCFDRFIPLVHHLDYPDYFSILRKCRNVIMGHTRQQALGTLLIMIYLGANVFLYRDSILFRYFRHIGVEVRSIEDLLENREFLEYKISDKELMNVRTILINHWGKHLNICDLSNISLLAKF
jgi:dTDP-N-acetylfucosamine:lipid II N-acetylfucosaminyltransferase